MAGKLIAAVLSLSLIAASPAITSAAPARQDKAGQSTTSGPRKHLTTIVMAGLVGAILGLSTLSFYGRPQDKLSNIAAGFAVGIIIGAGYSTYKAATEPKDFYALKGANPEAWTLANENSLRLLPAAPLARTGFTFQF